MIWNIYEKQWYKRKMLAGSSTNLKYYEILWVYSAKKVAFISV